MKRMLATMLVIMLLLGCVPAMAATSGYVVENRIATRSGPSTSYTEPGSFLYRGAEVTIHTKVWDDRNEIYWLQVEFTSGREKYRVYTGNWRISTDLYSIPDESILAYSWLNYSTYGYAGPGYDYHYYGDIMLYKDGNCRVMEVENNFALVDTSASTKGATRVWVPLDAVAGGYDFYGMDTYPDEWWSDGPTLIPDDNGATLLPGDDYNSGYVNPVGRYVTVWVESGNARSGPGTNYDFVNYVHRGDVLQVLDWEMGNTGKDWYQVRINGRLCWVSSGLVTLDGNSEGTAYGVPIVPEDPFADYQQTSTHLIGRWIRINPSSAHVRKEPNTNTATVGYVTQNQCYEILDCRIGNTGKVWYKIWVEGEYGWISSGLTTLLGN
ncbi:MAG: SH3 domain-containing protein [Clostridia bacterium]|nr:SH3 domain-containing protein [Clostridia bacterium]